MPVGASQQGISPIDTSTQNNNAKILERRPVAWCSTFGPKVSLPNLGSVASHLSHAGSLRKPEMHKLVRELCQADGQSDGVTDDPLLEMEA